jgi:hypothetical protein
MDKGFTINVYPASEGGYMVDVYEQELMDLIGTMMGDMVPDPADGGHATGDLAQALEMGKSLALDLAKDHD